MYIATWSKDTKFSRIRNSDSFTLDPYQVTLSNECFQICTQGERLKTLTLNREPVDNKPVLQSKLNTSSDAPHHHR